MATGLNSIDDYTHGGSGTLFSNGASVGYQVLNTDTSAVENKTAAEMGEHFSITTGAYAPAGVNEPTVVTSNILFDDTVSGIQIELRGLQGTQSGMVAPDNIAIVIDGQEVNLNDLIASGEAVYDPSTSLSYIRPSDGHITSDADHGTAEFATVSTLIITRPLTHLGITQRSDYSNSFSGEPHSWNGGNFDVSLTDDVTIGSAPCFTAGTLVETDKGQVKVESLKTGDRVRTKDHGFQPVKWIGGSRVHDAPVRIKAGTFGNGRDLVVSPRHRMLLQGWQMGLLFNHDEAFAAAKDMQNGTTITMEPEGWVTYYHILLDRHEVIYAEGAETESFFPDEASLNSMAKKTREELAQTVDLSTFGRAARPTLTANQAMYLSHNMDLLEDTPDQIAAE